MYLSNIENIKRDNTIRDNQLHTQNIAHKPIKKETYFKHGCTTLVSFKADSWVYKYCHLQTEHMYDVISSSPSALKRDCDKQSQTLWNQLLHDVHWIIS